MSGVQPVAVYALKVPPGGTLIPAVPDAAAMFRLSMAAVDPDEEPDHEEFDSSKRPRATLKIVRPPPGLDLEDSDDEYEDDDEEDSDDDEEVNGGPSDKEKARKLKQEAARKEMEEAMDEDDDEDDEDDGEFDLQAAISKLVKGKAPATDDDDDESDEGMDLDEAVVCTLNPETNCQQPLDITVSENERIFFKVTGTHTVYLTGNYVMPMDEGRRSLGDYDDEDEDEDEDEYDLSPDEDELDMDVDEESDDLDQLENPRITEVESDEEEAPKLVEAKGKNKRAADSDDEVGLDAMIAKDAGAKSTNGDAPLSKKQQKKLKKNDGAAAAVEQKQESKESKESKEGKDGKDGKAKTDKKVQFAKNLEQGPTPSSQDKKPSEKITGTLGVKEVKGVKIDDRTLGKGPAVAKAGNSVSMRYIGKLENGKVFDSNKKGKPFSFKLGKGEVIQGMEIGVTGMAAGGERRVTIPPHMAYGKKDLPGIPGNSKLIFDIKLLAIN